MLDVVEAIEAQCFGGPLDGAEGMVEYPAPRTVTVTRGTVSADYELLDVRHGTAIYGYIEARSIAA